MSTALTAATLALEQGRFGDIVASLEQAASIDTRDSLHWQRILDIAGRIGDDDVSLKAARQLVQLTPKDIRRRLVLRELLGETFQAREALTLARKLEEENPTDPMLSIATSVLLARLGR